MITPKLDRRNTKDILNEIKRKSEFYTPEWRFDIESPDGGSTLARLFAEMFFETIDRYNRFPDKCYLEFLNMLGICAKSVSPAVGMVRAQMVEGAGQSAYIKKGTRLFTDIENEDTRVIFETTSGFYATPAEIKAIYMTDPDEDIITRSDPAKEDEFPVMLYAPQREKNLERHCFAFAHANVLKINGSAEIYVKITNSSMSYQNEQFISRLCDPSFAHWSYISENGKVELTAVARQDCIALLKESREPIKFTNEKAQTDEPQLLPWIFCEIKAKKGEAEIAADSVAVSSVSTDDEFHRGIIPDSLFANDIELNTKKCEYCFGREPSAYDSFYICCDEAFSKGGALIAAEFSLNTVVYQDNTLTDGSEPEFSSKLLIDKDETKSAPYDNIYISEIIWEYWNGYGWSRLDVSGDVNPFSCDEQSARKKIHFTCPNDIAYSMQNAHEGLWIRARVVSVENRYSTRARWLLPLLKSVSLRFDYGNSFLPANSVLTFNSCSRRIYSNKTSGILMELFRFMPEQHHAVYFMFDRPPEGHPVNIYMDFAGNTDSDRVINFQYLTGNRSGRISWMELKTADRTNSFGHSGIISFYCPKDFCETELFGERGCWIRAVNRSMDLSAEHSELPRLTKMVMNAVDIVQKESISDERHQIDIGKPFQSFGLLGNPVISCELWVNEISETPISELRHLKECSSTSVRMVTDSDGQISECWVRWERRDTLINSEAYDRHYELIPSSGIIRFGDGINGKIPAYFGTVEASVDYSYGGGTVGNLPAEGIDGLVAGIPFVDNMTNFRPTCGGSSGQSLQAIRRIGAKRLKHLGSAVTAEDFESIILEEFTEVCEVKCFSNRNAEGISESGCVTVVVMPNDFTDQVYALSLCRRIYDYISVCADTTLVSGGRLNVVPVKVMHINSEITLKPDDYEYAAETEQNAAKAVNALIDSAPQGNRIGFMPTNADVISVLKQIEHISYVSGVMLIGEYYRGSQKKTVPLDDTEKYRFFVAAGGTHTIKLR